MTTPSTQLPPRSGLSLIEVVFATAVLSIVLLGVTVALARGQRLDVVTRERQAASEEAFKMLDSMLAGEVPNSGSPRVEQFDVPFNYTGPSGTSFNLRPADPYPTDPWTWAGATAPSNVTMAGVAVARVDVDVTDDNGTDAGNADLMEVRVTVAWRSADADQQRIEIVGRRIR